MADEHDPGKGWCPGDLAASYRTDHLRDAVTLRADGDLGARRSRTVATADPVEVQLRDPACRGPCDVGVPIWLHRPVPVPMIGAGTVDQHMQFVAGSVGHCQSARQVPVWPGGVGIVGGRECQVASIDHAVAPAARSMVRSHSATTMLSLSMASTGMPHLSIARVPVTQRTVAPNAVQ